MPTTTTTSAASFSSSASEKPTPSSRLGSQILTSTFTPDKISTFTGNDIPRAIEALVNADAVCFDVDSTVVQEEGIDVLAETLGKGKEVAEWTAKAMEGNTKFEDALAARLSIIQPSLDDIHKCLSTSPLQLTPGVDKLIQTLHRHDIDVYFVSGGFRIMIEPVAERLNVPQSNIVANTILFDAQTGRYAGFDTDEPTSADMGKHRALLKIKQEKGYDNMVMIGDGATDAQAVPPADAFIGFGGVVVREAVREKACWYVMDFDDIIAVMKNHAKNKKEM